LALAAGVLAGSLGWLLGEPIHARFAPPKFVNTASSSGGFLAPAEVYKLDMAKQRAQIFDAALVFGAFGMSLGLALGLAGTQARRIGRAAWKPAVFGLVLGGIEGAVATALALSVYYQVHNPDTNDLIAGLLTHVVISAAIGAAGGAAFGLGIGDRGTLKRAAVGGLLGACAGALAYQILGAVVFPLDEISSPISVTWHTRLVGRLAVTVLASAGAALGVLDRKPEARPAAGTLTQSA